MWWVPEPQVSMLAGWIVSSLASMDGLRLTVFAVALLLSSVLESHAGCESIDLASDCWCAIQNSR